NALEPGIDIGALQAAVLLGYPGTVASTWQQMGRAGRREDLSAAFLVATSSPIDQYVVQHPGYVLDRSPEAGLVNPDNLHVLVHHLKCAAFEIPFEARERFGTEDTPGVLSYLDEQGVLHESGGKYHWSDQAFPAETTSLRTATNDNVVIVDTTGPAPRTVGSEHHDGKARVIGEIDRFAAQELLHDQAIYRQGSKQFEVGRVERACRSRACRPRESAAWSRAAAAHVRPARSRAGRGGAFTAHRAADDLPLRHDTRRDRLQRATLQIDRRTARPRPRAPRLLWMRNRLSVLRRSGLRPWHRGARSRRGSPLPPLMNYLRSRIAQI